MVVVGSGTMTEFDDDVKPIIDELDSKLEQLQAAVAALYNSEELNEQTIPEKLSLSEQADFATVSAFALTSCLYGLKKVSNQPIDAQLLEKLVRVKEYHQKARRANVSDLAAAASSAAAPAKGSKKVARKAGDDISTVADMAQAEQKQPESDKDDDEGAEPAKKAHRTFKVNAKAVERLMR